MKYYILFVLFSLTLNAADISTFDFGQDFFLVDDNSLSIKLAKKSYRNPITGKEVILLAMVHFANDEFYKNIEEETNNFNGIILYEKYAWPVENSDKLAQKYNCKESELETILFFEQDYRYYVYSYYGAISQSSYQFPRNFYQQKKFIRADIDLDNPYWTKEEMEQFWNSNMQDTIKQFYEKNFRCKEKTAEGNALTVYERYNDFIVQFKKCKDSYLNFFDKNAAWKSICSISSHKPNEHPLHLKRDQIVVEKLREALLVSDMVMIMYGADHMIGATGIEAKLSDMGFKPQSVNWLTSFQMK